MCVMLTVGLSLLLPIHSAPFLCHPHPLVLLLSAQRPDVGLEAPTVPGAWGSNDKWHKPASFHLGVQGHTLGSLSTDVHL